MIKIFHGSFFLFIDPNWDGIPRQGSVSGPPFCISHSNKKSRSSGSARAASKSKRQQQKRSSRKNQLPSKSQEPTFITFD